jgi:serine/threonine protein kinase
MSREVKIADHLRHRSVTTYAGLFVEADNPQSDYYIVSYFVNGGHAREYLAKTQTPEVAEKLIRCMYIQLTRKVIDQNSLRTYWMGLLTCTWSLMKLLAPSESR